ncbi:hypothetical protein Aduo_019542 [Ancylostoma duodenale]
MGALVLIALAALARNNHNEKEYFKNRCGGTRTMPITHWYNKVVVILSRGESLKSPRFGSVFVHPLYNACKSVNDIAIIELDGEATGVSPICLPEESDKISGSACTFGVKMDAEPHRLDVVKDLLLELQLTAWKEEDGKIKTRDNGVNLCGGKLGAPLFQYNRAGQATLFGAFVDRDSDCRRSPKGNKVITGSFTDVRKHLDWICNLTGVCPLGKVTSTTKRLFERDRDVRGYCTVGYTLSRDKAIVNKGKCSIKRDDRKQ